MFVAILLVALIGCHKDCVPVGHEGCEQAVVCCTFQGDDLVGDCYLELLNDGGQTECSGSHCDDAIEYFLDAYCPEPPPPPQHG